GKGETCFFLLKLLLPCQTGRLDVAVVSLQRPQCLRIEPLTNFLPVRFELRLFLTNCRLLLVQVRLVTGDFACDDPVPGQAVGNGGILADLLSTVDGCSCRINLSVNLGAA